MLGSIRLVSVRLAGIGLTGIELVSIWLSRSGAVRVRLGGAVVCDTRLSAAPRGAARGPLRCHPVLLRWRCQLLLLGLPVGGLGDTGSGRSGRYDVPRHLCSSRPPKHTVYRRTIRCVPGSAR